MSEGTLKQTGSHPALLRLGEDRARNVQNRIADSITRFAGSMGFVWFV
jgi:uncharacterized membrane protein